MPLADARSLYIPGAWELTPQVFDDTRGLFLETFSARDLAARIGVEFHVAQANVSVSREGTVRGLHFSDVPPGQAKLVTAVTGTVLDVIVDVRVGSPTFGESVSVMLEAEERTAVYLAEGLAHGFLALEPDSTVSYLVSTPYTPEAEHGIDPFDPALGIDWPAVALDGTPLDYVLSDKDRAAPRFAELESVGALPRWDVCAAYLPQRP